MHLNPQAVFSCCFMSPCILHSTADYSPLWGKSLFWQTAVPACSCLFPCPLQCPFLSLGSVAGVSAACDPLHTAFLGREPETAQHPTAWCPYFQHSCSSLYRDIECYRAPRACNTIGLVMFCAFLKSQLVNLGLCMGTWLFTLRKRLFFKSVTLLNAGKRQKNSKGI